VLKTKDLFPVRVEDAERLDRRRFLRAVGGAAVFTLCGEWAAHAFEEARPHASEVHLDGGQRLAVGQARALTDAAGGEVLAVRVDDATVVAFDRRCPHLGCPVLWSAEHARFECPCHRAAFDARTGRVLFGPPRRGLASVKLASAQKV